MRDKSRKNLKLDINIAEFFDEGCESKEIIRTSLVN